MYAFTCMKYVQKCLHCDQLAAFEKATSNTHSINGVVYNEIIEAVFMTKRSLRDDVLRVLDCMYAEFDRIVSRPLH